MNRPHTAMGALLLCALLGEVIADAAFDKMDLNADGVISLAEYQQASEDAAQRIGTNCSGAECSETKFDCNVGFARWTTGWSLEKTLWCCEHEQKGCKEDEDEDGLFSVTVWAKDLILPITGAYLAVFVLGNFLHRNHISFIPESLVTIMIGMLAGYVMKNVLGEDLMSEHLESFINSMILNLVLLPIIIFESGWSIRRRDFVSQLGYIVIFAIAGTVISMVVVGGLILQFGNQHGITNPRTALCFASLISAVDPVATLATFAHLNVEPLLNILVLGESIINDAVAIVLFEVMNDNKIMGDPGTPLPETSVLVMKIVQGVFFLLFGSMFLGIALCFVYVLILRFGQMRSSPSLQILFVFISCFFSYALAQSVGLSGIVTVLFNSIMMGAFARPHMSAECSILGSFLFKQMASLADMMVFLFVGFAVIYVDSQGLTFFWYLMPICLLGRACAVFPLSVVTNCIKSCVGRRLEREKTLMIAPKHMMMMWWAGLRGGIALALVLEMGQWVNIEGGNPHAKAILRNATFLLIFAFLLVFGGSTEAVLKSLKISMGSDVDKDELLYAEQDQHGMGYRILRFVNKKAMIPVLVGKESVYRETKRRPDRLHGHSPSVGSEGVMSAALEDAQTQEEAMAHDRVIPGNGSAAPYLRKSSTVTSQERAELHQLFGTDDPAHLDDMQAITSVRRGVDEDCDMDDETDEEDDDEVGYHQPSRLI